MVTPAPRKTLEELEIEVEIATIKLQSAVSVYNSVSPLVSTALSLESAQVARDARDALIAALSSYNSALGKIQ